MCSCDGICQCMCALRPIARCMIISCSALFAYMRTSLSTLFPYFSAPIGCVLIYIDISRIIFSQTEIIETFCYASQISSRRGLFRCTAELSQCSAGSRMAYLRQLSSPMHIRTVIPGVCCVWRITQHMYSILCLISLIYFTLSRSN